MSGTPPIPYWMSDPDYYGRNDPRREKHLREINVQRRITARIVASSGDHSYSVIVTRRDLP